MSSRARKAKKKTKSCNDAPKPNRKIHAYFTGEEIAEIKAVTKTKDVTSVPFVVAATFLYKPDLLKQLLKEGYNVNQTAQNNMTALMWAVKHKLLDLVEFLLNNGADPTVKTDSGDNVLILALEHKLWDQESMINLWRAVKRVSFIDVNFTNKNGHNILHMCVRRDWEDLLKILLMEKPDIDAPNSNGVTPLMLACFRNNIAIIDILISAGASVTKEDNHGRMTLCYAISSSIVKTSKPPFLAIDRIIAELKKSSSIGIYLKRRLDLIASIANKGEISCATSEMFTKIVQFAVQLMEDAAGVFVECHAFVHLFQVIESRLDNPPVLKFLLEVCAEILFYNEQSAGYKPDLHSKLLEQFFTTGIDITFHVLQSKTDAAKIALDLIILAHAGDSQWTKVLMSNRKLLKTSLDDHQIPTADEARLKILKNKKRKLKKCLEVLEAQPEEDRRRPDSICYSKKSGRRSKALKAKLRKMKNVELDKRLYFNSKRFQQRLEDKISSPETLDSVEVVQNATSFKAENPLAWSFQQILQGAPNSFENVTYNKKKWIKALREMSTRTAFYKETLSIDQDKLLQATDHLNRVASSRKFDVNTSRSLNILLDYLRQLVMLIAKKYKEHWDNDRSNGCCRCLDLNEHVPWFFVRHLKALEAREQFTLQELYKGFENLVKTIKDLSYKNLEQCLKAINNVESTILNHEIRGIKCISFVSGVETFTAKYFARSHEVRDGQVVSYMQNVVNGIDEERSDIEIELNEQVDDVLFTTDYKQETPMELYQREVASLPKAKPRNKRKEIESKLNTIANGFHLINPTMSICNESSDNNDDNRVYGISDLNHPLSSQCPKPHFPKVSDYNPVRLKSQIAHLQASTSYQTLLNGRIRMSSKEQRVNYVISAGINFTAVEMGLDDNNQPLAIKKVPSGSWLGKMLKTLVEPLLGLVHRHILHYFACEFDGEELILATPLCKWTLAQYVQMLQLENNASASMTTMRIVRQFMDGLCVLHRFDIPIVHGNLKPSNVFVDFNGKVKIAEFGIHKALYKIIEAPKSSLIWFAKETIDVYKTSSIVECSCKSDIQVAGMLMYFTLSGGKHPFGNETDEILSNIQRGVTKLDTRSIDMRDLLLWMLLSDVNERPNIETALSHTFFWSGTKKWHFILACAGITPCEYIPFNVEKLHRSILAYSDSYIKIDWHELLSNKYPYILITESNTVTGLLRFIKNYHVQIGSQNLSNAIFDLFPALPVALYRTLQHTNWLKHAIFMPFSEVF